MLSGMILIKVDGGKGTLVKIRISPDICLNSNKNDLMVLQLFRMGTRKEDGVMVWSPLIHFFFFFFFFDQ